MDVFRSIAPYHDAPNANIAPPDSCAVTAATFLIRHTSIYANDDEWEEYMAPFAERVKKAQKAGTLRFSDDSPLAFLQDWECPINDDNLEKATEPGLEDAYQLGKRFRDLYGQLMPPKNLGRKKHRHHGGKGKGKSDGKPLRKGRSARTRRNERRHAREEREAQLKKPKVPFKVWSASSGRDVDTSKAWVRGAFPHWQNGDDGEGDQDTIKLIAVPNKVSPDVEHWSTPFADAARPLQNKDWADSLTPHKICDAFSKEPGKPEAQTWLENYGPPVVERLNKLVDGLEIELNDVIAMQMLCGYETVVRTAALKL